MQALEVGGTIVEDRVEAGLELWCKDAGNWVEGYKYKHYFILIIITICIQNFKNYQSGVEYLKK